MSPNGVGLLSSCWLRAALCAIGMWLCLGWNAVAQTTGAAGQEPKESESKPNVIRPTNEDEAVLIDDNGQVVRLPLSATLKKVLQGLKRGENGADSAERKFSVNRVSLEGAAEPNDDFVTLTATISIVIVPDNVDVLVPLKLNDATLRNVEHTGPNDATFDRSDQESGKAWWLRGKGEHELKLTLDVPIRKQGASRRLLLNLPDPPVSEIKLSLPLPRVSVKVPERAVARVRSIDNGRAEVQAFGFDRLLDLSWHGVTDIAETRTELQVLTNILVDLRTESLVLEATQMVRSIQGTFDKFTVGLPAEFELLDVSGVDVKEHRAVSGSPSRVQVMLAAPTSGPVQVKWLLSAKLTADAKRLPAIDGFEVEEARKQNGFVAITGWDGINLRKLEGEDRFLHRASQTELQNVPGFLPAGANNGNFTVYRFMKQPFRLVMEVQKIEPYFSVEPLHVVSLQPGNAELDSTLRIQVHRGAFQELSLPWPTVKAEAWDAVTSETPDLVEAVTVQDGPNGSALRIRLLDRMSRADGAFEVRLKSKRTVPTDGTLFDLSLPAVSATGQHRSTVVVVPADNLSVDWEAREGVAARPTTPDEAIVEQLATRRQIMAWQWDVGAPVFAVKAKVQRQTIKTESLSELTLNARTIGVSQRISYDIAFEGASQLRLMVPRSVADRVRFQWRDVAGNSRPLTPVFTGIEIDQSRQCRLHFDGPQLGKLDVFAEFELERPEDGMSDSPPVVHVPVLQSSDADFSVTRVRWRTGERLTASLDDSAWKPELASDRTAVWGVTGTKPTIGVVVRTVGESELQDFSVERAVIRSVLQEGRTHSQALFELDRELREVTLFLPAEISPQDFRAWWNRSEVERVERATATGEVEVRLKLPRGAKARVSGGAGRAKGELFVDFFSQKPTKFRWRNQHELAVPRFSPNVWVAQTMWEIVLPPDQHLLTLPGDYAPQFQWRRSLLMWQRQPNFGYDRIEGLLKNSGPPKGIELTDGNVYPISCFGPPQPLAFDSMSGSAVFGCGAGFALLLGFVLIRIPATRHILTFLTVGFLLALASLWFAEPVQVLLQPAILGTAMAVVAALIDRVGRKAPVPLVTLTAPSDFYGRGSSIISVGGAVVDPEAPTAAPGTVLPPEAVSLSGPGGRE